MANWDEKLCTAANEGNIKDVELSIQNGANLEYESDYFGMTPLMMAAGGGHLEVVTYLVTHGSQLEVTDVGGMTPLMLAAWGGHLEVVTYLVTHGSQLEVTDTRYGMTPLMWAALGGHLEVVTYLVTHGSQLEVTETRSGETALHYAARNGGIDITKLLIDQGCSPWVKTKKGQTPYDMVTMKSYDSEETKRKKTEMRDFLKGDRQIVKCLQ